MIITLFLILFINIFSYAYLMSLIKKEQNLQWLKYESLLTFLSTFSALVAFSVAITDSSNPYQFFTGLLLALTLVNSVVLSVIHLRTTEVERFSTVKKPTALLLASIIFSASVISLLSFVFSFIA